MPGFQLTQLYSLGYRYNDIHLIVFEIAKPDNIIKIVKGEKIGTLIK